ncbi:hypothetical protein CEK26_003227 [Fusarium fujikuroi]|nr:hypothetical protein CEK27_003222 [Fusarium fujikuroi]QGJ01783.1 hypothetical protein CEK26_003227 [Fusarium fujikuroi]
MENSAHQLRAELEASANATQNRPTCRELQPGDEYDELNIISNQSLRDDCGYCHVLKSAINSLADRPTTQIFVHSKEGEPIGVEYFTEKKSDSENSYTSKAGFIIYSHDKVDNLFHQYEYLVISIVLNSIGHVTEYRGYVLNACHVPYT